MAPPLKARLTTKNFVLPKIATEEEWKGKIRIRLQKTRAACPPCPFLGSLCSHHHRIGARREQFSDRPDPAKTTNGNAETGALSPLCDLEMSVVS